MNEWMNGWFEFGCTCMLFIRTVVIGSKHHIPLFLSNSYSQNITNRIEHTAWSHIRTHDKLFYSTLWCSMAHSDGKIWVLILTLVRRAESSFVLHGMSSILWSVTDCGIKSSYMSYPAWTKFIIAFWSPVDLVWSDLPSSVLSAAAIPLTSTISKT